MILELFSCAGGMSLGFEQAGIAIDVAVDKDPVHCDSYRKNMGISPLCIDVRDLIVERQVEGLIADPPCTPWSTAGNRQGLADDRCMLAATRDLILRVNPEWWLIANVPGFEVKRAAAARKQIFEPLEHRWHIDYALLNAADYGVPQVRRRPFWFGHRLDGRCLAWPAPTHSRRPGLFTLPWVTVAEALADIDTWGELITLYDKAGAHAERMRGVLRINDKHPPCRVDRPAHMVTARRQGGQGSDVLLIDHEVSAQALLLHTGGHSVSQPHQPAKVITASDKGGRGGAVLAYESLGSGIYAGIRLSERCLAILQGFPDGWVFSGNTKRARRRQIGMAMPPPMARAVASEIKKWMKQ